MKTGNIKGNFSVSNGHITFSLGMMAYEDEGFEVLYCPALRMYGYGNTEEEAKEDFACVLSITVDYMVKKKTLNRVLESYGWIVKKKNKEYFPPDPMNLIEHDKNFKREVLESDSLRWKSERVEIPII